MKLPTFSISLVFLASLLLSQFALAGDKLFPFYLASQNNSDAVSLLADTKSKLTGAGFEVVGEYSPYQGTTIIIITSDELKANAAASKHGGFGAIQRVSITDVKGDIQLAYTNPIYMSYGYRMKGDLAAVEAKLKSALGFSKTYGMAKGMSADDLQGYHYMFGMPYFDDPVQVADHGSYDKAVKALESGLAAKKGGVSQVFKVELKGKKEAVFGVAMTQGKSADKMIMTEIDFKEVRSSAHLPYEVLVTENGEVYILGAEFRIALNYPDLSMAGSNSFMGIMASPDAIADAIKAAAN